MMKKRDYLEGTSPITDYEGYLFPFSIIRLFCYYKIIQLLNLYYHLLFMLDILLDISLDEFYIKLQAVA